MQKREQPVGWPRSTARIVLDAPRVRKDYRRPVLVARQTVRAMVHLDAIRLLDATELGSDNVAACTVALAAGRRRLMIVRVGQTIRAYLNSCRQRATGPDPGVLLGIPSRHLQCAMRGAWFRLDDGVCLAGPCAGAALVPVPIIRKRGYDIRHARRRGPAAVRRCPALVS